MWPTTISHRIDVSSPLYGFSDEQLTDGRVEVILADLNCSSILVFPSKVIVNVVGEHSSGGSIDSRTSYIGNEIVWGARSTL